MGNSGSGKDTIISILKKNWDKNLPKLVVPRRYITRKKHPSEKFFSVSPRKFQRMKSRGKFSFTWESYGNYYGISSKLDKWLKKGKYIVINVSRSIISKCKERYHDCQVIYIHVPMHILEQRIKRRGREKIYEPAYFQRLTRAQENIYFDRADKIIDNSSDVEAAVRQLKEYLLHLS